MALSEYVEKLNFIRRFTDGDGRLTREAIQWVQGLVDSANSNATVANTDIGTAQTSATAAQTQADLSGYRSKGDVVNLHTDATGTQPTNGTTRDLTAYFYDETGAEIATRTLRGTYSTTGDTFTVTAQSTTGEATTYALENDGTDAVRATVTHTASGAKATLGWTFLDETVAGSVPVTGGGK